MASIYLLRFSQIPTSRSAIPNAKQRYPAASSFSSTFWAFPLPVPECRGSSRKKCSTVGARMSSSPTPATDRLVSAAAYALPFFNALPYGRFLLSQYPSLRFLFEPLIPLLSLYQSVPFASFVAFFGLYLGVVRNPSFSDYVRFNAMQAVTLDVLLALPVLFAKIFNPGRSGLGLKFTVWGHHAVFVFGCFCFVYAFLSCVLGKTPYLPFIADAAASFSLLLPRDSLSRRAVVLLLVSISGLVYFCVFPRFRLFPVLAFYGSTSSLDTIVNLAMLHAIKHKVSGNFTVSDY